MTRLSNDFEKMSKQVKITIYFLIVLSLGIIAVSIKSTMAYYSDTDDFSILAAKVGDFGDKFSDINMVIWKKDGTNGNNYVKTYSIPETGFTFKQGETKCYDPSNKETVINCNNNGTGDCHYSYNNSSHEMTLSSNKRVVCNFYFDNTQASDIDTFIYIQSNEIADRTFEGKDYELASNIPTEGYSYYTSNCEQSTGSVSVNDDGITVASTTKNKCFVYYNKD